MAQHHHDAPVVVFYYKKKLVFVAQAFRNLLSGENGPVRRALQPVMEY